jgi:hypothetical protein
VDLKKKTVLDFQVWRRGDSAPQTPRANPGLSVTVIATTAEGTTAALHAASWLAVDLDARITLLKMEVIPPQFLADYPTEILECNTRQQFLLIPGAGATEEEVFLRTCLCHDLASGLQHTLRRRALVVIGGRKRWWSSGAEKLEIALRRLGHHVIFIDVRRKKEWGLPRGLSAFLDSVTATPFQIARSSES